MKGWFQSQGRCTSPQLDGAGVCYDSRIPAKRHLVYQFHFSKSNTVHGQSLWRNFLKIRIQCEVLEVLMTQDDVRTFSGHVFGRLAAWRRWEIREEEEI